MPIAEEKALEILAELIKKPESKAEDIPRIWGEIIAVYNQQFTPVEAAPKRKRRRGGNPNIGWPAGVGREEFKAWKEGQQAKGVTENLNPQTYKRLRDAGQLQAAEKPAEKAAAKPATKRGKSA
ncbi:MAG TPA: hypothetical protein V6D47_21385 [Oscillatoriaceae cyanobacterium]